MPTIFFRRLESVARYDEITTIVLNHLEPDHSGALPELLRRAPNARVYLSSRAQMMLKALLKPSSNQAPPDYTLVTTGDTIDLGGRTLAFFTRRICTGRTRSAPGLVEEGMLFSGDVWLPLLRPAPVQRPGG